MVTDGRIIVKENTIEYDENGKPCNVYSTVGIKFKYNGEWFGQVIYFLKAFLEVIDVVQATNQLLKSMERAVEEFGRTQDVRKDNYRQ